MSEMEQLRKANGQAGVEATPGTNLHLSSAQIKQWDVGVAGAVVRDGRVLMVRKTYGESMGRWEIPGGFARRDERLDEAAIREVREETGIEAEVVDLIGVRTRYNEQGGAVFVVFRMCPLTDEPMPDEVEVDRAEYFTASEIAENHDACISALTRSAATAALWQTRRAH